MAFTRKPYTTLDEVKLALNVTSTADDDFITEKITEAQDVIDDYLSFSYQTDGTVAAPATRTYDGNGSAQLLIDRCLSLSSVKIQTYTVSTDQTGAFVRTADTPTDITGDCMLGPANTSPGFILTRLSGYLFPVGTQNIVITGTFGVSGQVPSRIALACKLLAVHYVKMRDANYEDQVGATGLGAPVYRKSMPPEVKEILDRAKRPFFYMG